MTKPKFKNRKPKYGIGINDADYSTSKCRYYKKWNALIFRCYSEKTKQSYREVTVCDKWLLFSNFRAWCIKQEKEVGDISKLELDKDLLGNGAKTYSPSTCCFLPRKVNNFLENTSRGTGLMGARKQEKVKGTKYEVEIRNPINNTRKQIGTYLTERRAHQSYILGKTEIAQQIAYHTDLIPQQHVKDALITFYPNLRSSIIH
ncbi:hypothetical protein AB4452_04605 [Vibrio lentus]